MSKTSEYCLLILTAIAITFSLIYTKSILIPFIFALFIYFSMLPMINMMIHKLKISRTISISLTVLLFIISIALLGSVIFESIQDFSSQAIIYKSKLLTFMQFYEQAWDIKILTALNQETKYFLDNLPIFSWLKSISSITINFITNLVLVSLFFLFLIIGKPEVKKDNLLNAIQNKVSHYITLKFFFSLITGLVCGVILFLFGVKLAFLFGLLTALLNFIPNVGSIIAVLIPIPILILNFGFSWTTGIILSLLTLIQFVVGNILEPKVLGNSMDLHPITILMFLIFWGLVWGLPGMFLAVPITATLKIIFSQINPTKKIANLMAGKLS